jgi:hypothetical protein
MAVRAGGDREKSLEKKGVELFIAAAEELSQRYLTAATVTPRFFRGRSRGTHGTRTTCGQSRL